MDGAQFAMYAGYHFPLDATSDDIGYHEVVDPGCGGGWHDVLVQTGTTHHDAVYSTVHHDAVYTTVHHDARDDSCSS